jgi:hypothetical protein
MRLEVLLVGSKKSVHPWKPSLLAVISVKDDWYTVQLGNFTNMLGTSNGTSDRRGIVLVISSFTSDELSTSLGKGNHDGSTVLLGSLHTSIDGVSSNNIHARNGISLGFGIVKEVKKCLSSDNTRLDRGWELSEGLEVFKEKMGIVRNWRSNSSFKNVSLKGFQDSMAYLAFTAQASES